MDNGKASPYLRGWKEIATHLRTSVRTVQRWESLGLPIHRIGNLKVGGVFALVSEIDGWMLQQRTPMLPPSRQGPDRNARSPRLD